MWLLTNTHDAKDNEEGCKMQIEIDNAVNEIDNAVRYNIPAPP